MHEGRLAQQVRESRSPWRQTISLFRLAFSGVTFYNFYSVRLQFTARHASINRKTQKRFYSMYIITQLEKKLRNDVTDLATCFKSITPNSHSFTVSLIKRLNANNHKQHNIQHMRILDAFSFHSAPNF
jgi:hypothetical protein